MSLSVVKVLKIITKMTSQLSPPPQPLPPDSPGFGVIGVADAATKVRGGVRIRKELSLCLS